MLIVRMTAAARRLDVELARCNAVLLATHAHLSEGIAARLAHLLPVTRLVALYCRTLGLSQLDEAWVRIHALAHAGTGGSAHTHGADSARGPGASEAGGAAHRIWTSMREELRVRLAPHGDRALQETLAFEFAHARTVLLKVHVRNAVRLAESLRPDVGRPAAVALYISRMEVPEAMSGAVYAFALDRLGSARVTGMLSPGRSATGPLDH